MGTTDTGEAEPEGWPGPQQTSIQDDKLGSLDRITTWNINGWRSRGNDVIARLEEMAPAIMLVQEIRVDSNQQASIQRSLQRRGYSVQFGQPTPRARNKEGLLATSRGQSPWCCCYSPK